MKLWVVVLFVVALVRPAVAGDAVYACKAPTGKITVDFKPETSLKDLVTWIMGVSCKTVIVGAGVDVSTHVTIMAPHALTLKQALQLFTDAVDAAGFVVQDKGDDLVIKASAACARVAGPPSPDDLQADPLLANIKKLDDTHYEIAAKVIDAVLANPTEAARGARVVPTIKDGKPIGFKLYAIRPSSIYAHLGLRNGDTVKTINGYELTSPDKALDAYSKLRGATAVQLGLERRGKPLTLSITVK